MPGVLIIEAMAQVGAIVILKPGRKQRKDLPFSEVSTKLNSVIKVVPGTMLRMEVEIIQTERAPIGVGAAAAYDGDVKVAEAEPDICHRLRGVTDD